MSAALREAEAGGRRPLHRHKCDPAGDAALARRLAGSADALLNIAATARMRGALGVELLGSRHADAVRALERYNSMDSTFSGTREGEFLMSITTAYENLDADAFTDTVREYDESSRLDAQKTTLLLCHSPKGHRR